ncbi:Calx-beta domain-containing protein [Bdellovibrio bacteriovorus]|uniref:Calx-beta domain-containing protein n=1 Tax=Bdellovibrio bacteriovorus TaxID=959 RepID=UPI0035A64E11
MKWNVLGQALAAVLFCLLSGCGQMRADFFGRMTKEILPSTPALPPVPKVTKVDADTAGASSVSVFSVPRFTTAQVVPIQVHFSGPVKVTGVPSIELETGSVKRTAFYVSGSGTNILTFEYAVVAGDSAPTLDYTSSTALALNGGAIEPAEEVQGTTEDFDNLTKLPDPGTDESLSRTTPILIRTIPEVKKLSAPQTDVYLDGTSLEIVVKYDQPITVTGSPRIPVKVAGNTRLVNLISQISPSELLFRYEVVVGDNDTDGIELPTAIDLNGGSIVNPANETAVIALPVKDTTGVLTYTTPLTASFLSSTQIVSEGVGSINVPISLSTPAPIPFKVSISVLGEADGNDYVLASREVQFAAGEQLKYLNVQITDDTLPESEERLRLVLSRNSLGNGGDVSFHEIHIKDNDSGTVPTVVSMSKGYAFSCALFSNKDLKCWGDNSSGQLGNGTYVSTSAVNTVAMSDVEQFEVSHSLACALNSNQELWCWGKDNMGLIFPGSSGGKLHPNPVKVIASGVASFALHPNVICYVKTNATKDLMCWGYESTGIMAQGAVTQNRSFASALKVTDQVARVQIITGAVDSICVLKTNKDLYCWGHNGVQNSPATQIKTFPATPIDTNVTSFFMQGSNICTQKEEGTPSVRTNYCWGSNYNAQITPGTSTPSHIFTPVQMPLDYVETKPVGAAICGIKTDGSMWCWGWGVDLPSTNSTGNLAPYKVIPEGVASFLDVTYRLNPLQCVLMVDSSVRCWAGSSESLTRVTPVTVIPSGVSKVSLHGNTIYRHMCALLTNGEVQCWGRNNGGQVGDRTVINRLVPTQALARNQSQILTDRERSCAISTFGELRCWGKNSALGSLGMGTMANFTSPKLLIDRNVEKVTMNDDGGCAVLKNGELRCWGNNSDGQAKPGSTSFQSTPVVVKASGVRDVEMEHNSACYISTDDKLYCWGKNLNNQLGNGTTTAQNTLPATPTLENVSSVILGGGFSQPIGCALQKNGDLSCWGGGQSACLGTNSSIPKFMMADVRKYSVGPYGVCVITGDEGKLQCWGTNSAGELGVGHTSNVCWATGPATVVSEGVTEVSLGASATCFVLNTGELKCMGDNSSGVLGTGDTLVHPRTVFGLTN